MKRFYAKCGLLIFAGLLAGSAIQAQTSGGPDAYGYIWRNNLDPMGPAVTWIDITQKGTQVSGMSDDNAAAGWINLGFDFQYYYTTFNRARIGSNGWISFSNLSNIAHCFPAIPTEGGVGDNFLAPFLSDLSFSGQGNPGKLYHWTNNTDTFIVSYINVPWWIPTSPDYAGDASFQVILSAVDSSITYQYGSISGSWNETGGCATEFQIGIESINGQTGLRVRGEAEGLPMNNSAIKFYYPKNVTQQIKDVGVSWSGNESNGGFFMSKGKVISFQSAVRNVGNVDVSDQVRVVGRLRIGGVTQYLDTVKLNGLAKGVDTVLEFNRSHNPTTTGFGTFETIVLLTGDSYSGNNTITTEAVVVDPGASEVKLGYVQSNLSNGNLIFQQGGGGIEVIPPSYPFKLRAVEVNLTGNMPEDMNLFVLDDDGPEGLPGSELVNMIIPADQINPGGMNRIDLSQEIVINSGGFYVGFTNTFGGVGIGTLNTPPISRRSWEIVTGGWGQYRDNESVNLIIRAIGGITTGIGSDAAEQPIKVYPNPAQESFRFIMPAREHSGILQITGQDGRTLRSLHFTGNPETAINVEIRDLSPGHYTLSFTFDQGRTGRSALLIQ